MNGYKPYFSAPVLFVQNTAEAEWMVNILKAEYAKIMFKFEKYKEGYLVIATKRLGFIANRIDQIKEWARLKYDEFTKTLQEVKESSSKT